MEGFGDTLLPTGYPRTVAACKTYKLIFNRHLDLHKEHLDLYEEGKTKSVAK